MQFMEMEVKISVEKTEDEKIAKAKEILSGLAGFSYSDAAFILKYAESSLGGLAVISV
jgi:hypothetical protein